MACQPADFRCQVSGIRYQVLGIRYWNQVLESGIGTPHQVLESDLSEFAIKHNKRIGLAHPNGEK